MIDLVGDEGDIGGGDSHDAIMIFFVERISTKKILRLRKSCSIFKNGNVLTIHC